jgi:hypothetical protein
VDQKVIIVQYMNISILSTINYYYVLLEQIHSLEYFSHEEAESTNVTKMHGFLKMGEISERKWLAAKHI